LPLLHSDGHAAWDVAVSGQPPLATTGQILLATTGATVCPIDDMSSTMRSW